MLLISRSMDVRKIICIFCLCFIDKLVTSFSFFSFLLQLPISSSVSQIMKELCSSSSYSFCHLFFNGIMKKTNSSQNMPNPISFSAQKCPIDRDVKVNFFIIVQNMFLGFFQNKVRILQPKEILLSQNSLSFASPSVRSLLIMLLLTLTIHPQAFSCSSYPLHSTPA